MGTLVVNRGVLNATRHVFWVRFAALLILGTSAAWALLPLIDRYCVDPAWHEAISGFYPPALLDEEMFDDWLLCETTLRATIAFLFLVTICGIARKRPNLLVPGRLKQSIVLLSPIIRFRITLPIVAVVLTLMTTAILFTDWSTVQKRRREIAEEERLHPPPPALSSAEREALGSPISDPHAGRGVLNYELNGTNSVCPVHSIALRREAVPVLYGFITYPGWQLREGFPYGRLSVPGGCFVGQGEIAVLRCSNCVALNERYCETSEYQLRHTWKQQQEQFTKEERSALERWYGNFVSAIRRH